MEYQHGGDVYSHEVTMDFSANINPLGLPEGVKKALMGAIHNCSRYPDSRCRQLRKGLALQHGISAEEIICGNGAADLIFQIVQAIKPGRAVLTSPSFLEYGQALKAADCRITWYDLTDSETDAAFCLDTEAYWQFLERECQEGRKPDLIFLCNPNNPTGLATGKESMLQLLDRCEKREIFCVIDECFTDFLDQPQSASVLEYLSEGKWRHVFVLKAFTKLYAMAGVRLGYGICRQEELLRLMEEGRQPWSVSGLAQAAGEAALLEAAYVERTREVMAEERVFMKNGLAGLGFRVYDSKANYLFFKDTAGRPGALYEQCLKRRVLIRGCGNYRGLDGSYYRVCIKTNEENKKLLLVLQDILECV